ncbi:MAG: hypothetical protein GX876_04145 [Bacteroidales bacterium]|nr:hypothetical protein [Bacteroidales bacterium]
MIRSLKGYSIIKRNKRPARNDERKFSGIIVRLSGLLRFSIEIKEMDFNSFIGNSEAIIVVDVRTRIEK